MRQEGVPEGVQLSARVNCFIKNKYWVNWAVAGHDKPNGENSFVTAFFRGGSQEFRFPKTVWTLCSQSRPNEKICLVRKSCFEKNLKSFPSARAANWSHRSLSLSQRYMHYANRNIFKSIRNFVCTESRDFPYLGAAFHVDLTESSRFATRSDSTVYGDSTFRAC